MTQIRANQKVHMNMKVDTKFFEKLKIFAKNLSRIQITPRTSGNPKLNKRST